MNTAPRNECINLVAALKMLLLFTVAQILSVGALVFLGSLW